MVRSATRDLAILERYVADLRIQAELQENIVANIRESGRTPFEEMIVLRRINGAIEAMEMRRQQVRDSVHAGERRFGRSR